MRLPIETEHLISLLKRQPETTWGFVIYRTTYTPESNRRFPKLISIFDSYMKQNISQDYGFQKSEYRADYELIRDRHRFILMEDPVKLDGLSLPAVRSKFETWRGPLSIGKVNNRPQGQEVACLVVDQEVIDTLAHCEDEEAPKKIDDNQWVKAVEAFPDDLSDLEWYDGTLKVPIRDLWIFWSDLSYARTLDGLKQEDGLFLA